MNMPSMTKTMILTGGKAGRSGVLNGKRFDKGFCQLTLPENEMDSCLKYFKRCYAVQVVDGRKDASSYNEPVSPTPDVEPEPVITTILEPATAVDIDKPVETEPESEGADDGTVPDNESPVEGGSSKDETDWSDTSGETDEGDDTI
jgi:hypothetical protein